MRTIPVQISGPIDYEKLAKCFKAIGWRYTDGYATPEKLKAMVETGMMDLSKRMGLRQCCNSGGINIECHHDEIVVLIDAKLAAIYFKPEEVFAPQSQPDIV